MAEKFLMPKLSPTMEEGQIARWLKNEGDSYEANETLAEVDTDKATMEMTALTGGTILKVLKGAGETASLGEAIAITGAPGEDISALLAEIATVTTPVISAAKPEPTPEITSSNTLTTETPPVLASAPPQPAATGRILVSPIAARMASESGVDLSSVVGTGPQGRIIKRDIEGALAHLQTTKATAPVVFQTATVAGQSAYRDENASQMRRVIAERLTQSLGPIPTFYLTIEVEMDNALALRKQINAALPDEQKISVNDIIVKVAAVALTRHPFVNSSYQDRHIRFYEQADIGVAVAVDEGLITPIVRGANLKGIGQISAEIKEMAVRAREKKLLPDEYTGATFSISNLGMFGIKEFTAIINPPEAAILAVGGAAPMPVAREGQVVVRSMMSVTMSCDHRVVDGATGAKFLQDFKQTLENPALLLL
jgi:pyruvate dehydrogenase E2 component (dihydrolipoamide acetyltransferase)